MKLVQQHVLNRDSRMPHTYDKKPDICTWTTRQTMTAPYPHLQITAAAATTSTITSATAVAATMTTATVQFADDGCLSNQNFSE